MIGPIGPTGPIGPFALRSGRLPGFASLLVEGILQNLQHVARSLPVNARQVEPRSEAAYLTPPPPEAAVPQGTLAI